MNMHNKSRKDKIDIKDKEGNEVYFGDRFLAKMVEPSFEKGTIVTVIEDLSEENVACGRNYDLEDIDGNRLWNAYMVIVNGIKLI